MIIKDMKMLLVPSKLVWITGGEAALIPKQVECYLKRPRPQPTARSPQPAQPAAPLVLQEAPHSTIAGPFKTRNTKGICSGSVPTVRPFGS